MADIQPNFPTRSIGQAPRGPSDRPETRKKKLGTMQSASASLSRVWRLRASSAHPREAESDSFLASAAKIKQRLSGGVHVTMLVSRVLCDTLRYYDLIKKSRRITWDRWFPDKSRSTFFPSNRFEIDTIHKKSRFEIDLTHAQKSI